MCLCIHTPRFAVFAEPAARERAGEGAGSPPQHAPQIARESRMTKPASLSFAIRFLNCDVNIACV